jgi:DNA-nicking Smr family endonuclease
VSKKNPFGFVPDVTIDLHGHSIKQATPKIKSLKSNYPTGTKLRIIVGKGAYSNSPPVIPTLTKKLLNEQDISWTYAKPQDGGDGALDCEIID